MNNYEIEIKNLKRQIMSLEAQLEIQKDRVSKARGGNLLQTDAIDLYPGEQLDFLLSILEQVKKKCAPDSRPYEIIDSILSQNDRIGYGDEIMDELERVFKRGVPSDTELSKLKTMGFTYTQSRKHPKLRFHDRYMVTLPATSSDVRGGKNALSQISKCIAVSQKI